MLGERLGRGPATSLSTKASPSLWIEMVKGVDSQILESFMGYLETPQRQVDE